MSTANAVVTAKIGPGLTATAIALSDVTNVGFRVGSNTLSITHGTPQRISDFDYANIATVTWVITSGNAVVTVST